MALDWPLVLVALGGGLLVGQWVNVAANGAGQTLGFKLFACSRCPAPVGPLDLIPLLRWLAGRPNCGACGAARPLREPVTAVLVGVLFAIAAARHGYSLQLGHALIAVTLISLVAVTDAVYWVMPFVFTLPGLAIAMGASVLSPGLVWYDSALGAVTGFGLVFGYEQFAKQRWGGEPLGGGVKFYAGMVGALLGPVLVLVLIPLAIVHALLVGLVLLAFRKRASIPSEVEPEGWRPKSTMIQAGPIIGVASVELVLAGDLLERLVAGR